MKHRLTALVLFPLIAASCVPAVDVEADRAAIEAMRAAEGAAVAAGDVDAMTALHADDIVVMPPNEPMASGADAVRAWGENFMGMFSATVSSYTSDDIVIMGDVAIERYSGLFTLTPKAGGDSMAETIKGIHVYQRQADGSWKMTHDVWNSDEPLPGM